MIRPISITSATMKQIGSSSRSTKIMVHDCTNKKEEEVMEHFFYQQIVPKDNHAPFMRSGKGSNFQEKKVSSTVPQIAPWLSRLRLSKLHPTHGMQINPNIYGTKGTTDKHTVKSRNP